VTFKGSHETRDFCAVVGNTKNQAARTLFMNLRKFEEHLLIG
jgi:hypothetical protein